MSNSNYNNRMQAIRSKLTSLKNSTVSTITPPFAWIKHKYRNNKKKCRGTLLALAILILLTGLIVGSFKSVNSINQGVPINYSQGTIKDSSQSNYGSFLGLNTYYYTVPATSYLVSFNSQEYTEGSMNVYPSIVARAIEGIKVEIDVDAKVKLVPTNLKSFLEDYGMNKIDGIHEGWQIYIKEKIRNVVVQAVALYKFYSLSNKALANTINTQFSSYSTNTQLNYPFSITIISVNIHYPQDTIGSADTLGIKLLNQTSLMQQLTTQLSLLKSYISTYQSQVNNYTIKKAILDGVIASRQQSVKISSGKWLQGLQLLNTTFANQTLLQKHLQVYFNSLYNVTYRLDTMYPFRI